MSRDLRTLTRIEVSARHVTDRGEWLEAGGDALWRGLCDDARRLGQLDVYRRWAVVPAYRAREFFRKAAALPGWDEDFFKQGSSKP